MNPGPHDYHQCQGHRKVISDGCAHAFTYFRPWHHIGGKTPTFKKMSIYNQEKIVYHRTDNPLQYVDQELFT